MILDRHGYAAHNPAIRRGQGLKPKGIAAPLAMAASRANELTIWRNILLCGNTFSLSVSGWLTNGSQGPFIPARTAITIGVLGFARADNRVK